MKRMSIAMVLWIILAQILAAQSAEYKSELTIVDGVRFAVEPPYRIVASDSDEEQIVFARPDGILVTGALYYAEAADDIKAELYLYVRGNFFEDIDDQSKEIFSIETERGFNGVPGYWINLSIDGKQGLFFAADLREAPGKRVKFILFSTEGDPAVQASELRAFVPKLTIEIQEAAG
jgi:hypothetical protein